MHLLMKKGGKLNVHLARFYIITTSVTYFVRLIVKEKL